MDDRGALENQSLTPTINENDLSKLTSLPPMQQDPDSRFLDGGDQIQNIAYTSLGHVREKEKLKLPDDMSALHDSQITKVNFEEMHKNPRVSDASAIKLSPDNNSSIMNYLPTSNDLKSEEFDAKQLAIDKAHEHDNQLDLAGEKMKLESDNMGREPPTETISAVPSLYDNMDLSQELSGTDGQNMLDDSQHLSPLQLERNYVNTPNLSECQNQFSEPNDLPSQGSPDTAFNHPHSLDSSECADEILRPTQRDSHLTSLAQEAECSASVFPNTEGTNDYSFQGNLTASVQPVDPIKVLQKSEHQHVDEETNCWDPPVSTRVKDICPSEYGETLRGRLHSFYEGKRFIDVILHCEGERFTGHKVVLAACSRLLEVMMANKEVTSGPLHLQMDSHGVRAPSLSALLDFMYTGVIPCHLVNDLCIKHDATVLGVSQFWEFAKKQRQLETVEYERDISKEMVVVPSVKREAVDTYEDEADEYPIDSPVQKEPDPDYDPEQDFVPIKPIMRVRLHKRKGRPTRLQRALKSTRKTERGSRIAAISISLKQKLMKESSKRKGRPRKVVTTPPVELSTPPMEPDEEEGEPGGRRRRSAAYQAQRAMAEQIDNSDNASKDASPDREEEDCMFEPSHDQTLEDNYPDQEVDSDTSTGSVVKHVRKKIKRPLNQRLGNNAIRPSLSASWRQGDGTYKCPVCGWITSNNRNLSAHYMKHTGEKPHQCGQCDKAFIQKKHLADHEKIHSMARPYKCGYCDKCFKNSKHRSRHQLIHTDDRRWQCDECGKTFRTRKSMNTHVMTVHRNFKRYKCTRDGCEYETADSKSFKAHNATHIIQDGGDAAQFMTVCEVCGKSLMKTSLKLHVKQHKGELMNCSKTDCDFTSIYKHALESHLNRVHHITLDGKPAQRRYKCDMCEEAFFTPHELKQHKLRHSGQKPHKCPICDFAAFEKGTLTKHMRMHTGETPFKCKDCEKAFTSQSGLARHRRSHTGKKPHACDMCGKMYADKKSRDTHMYTHANEKPYICHVCNYGCTRMDYLQKHIREKHGETELESLKPRRNMPSPTSMTNKEGAHRVRQPPSKTFSPESVSSLASVTQPGHPYPYQSPPPLQRLGPPPVKSSTNSASGFDLEGPRVQPASSPPHPSLIPQNMPLFPDYPMHGHPMPMEHLRATAGVGDMMQMLGHQGETRLNPYLQQLVTDPHAPSQHLGAPGVSSIHSNWAQHDNKYA